MMERPPLRRGLVLEIRQLIAIETAARELFRELDMHCPKWREVSMASGEGTDGANRAWRALSSALGEPEDGTHA
jgi:hypothetical protein